MKTKIITTIIGVILLSFGISTLIHYNYGLAAFDSFLTVVGLLLGKNYVFALRLVQLSLLLILIIFKRKFKLRWTEIILSLVSVLVFSVLINYELKLVEIMFPTRNKIFLVLGFIVFCEGISLYVFGNILVAPNDKSLIVMESKLKHTYAFYKVITDVAMLLFAFVFVKIYSFDFPISYFTIFLTFASGFVVGIFTKINAVVFKLTTIKTSSK